MVTLWNESVIDHENEVSSLSKLLSICEGILFENLAWKVIMRFR
jgi:hypothetical protein